MLLVFVAVVVHLWVIAYGSFLSESFFSQFFDTFFTQFFNLPYAPDFLFPKCVKLNELGFFACWTISRIVTERLLRVLIHISNYFQTLEIMEKKLSDKNEPI